MKEKIQKNMFYIVYFFLMCYFMRIFNMPNELTLILGGMLSFVMILRQRKIRIDLGICFFAITLISYYVIINGAKGLLFSILYIPLVIYELGNYAVFECGSKKNIEYKILILISAMVIGYTIHGVLNSYLWFAGYAVPGTRRWPDFWSWDIVPGTQHAAYFMPIMSLLAPAIFYFKKQKSYNIIVIVLTMFFVYAGIATRSRMTILIFAIVFMIQLFMYFVLEWDKAKNQVKSKTLWVMMVLCLIVLVIIVIGVKDSAIVVTFINNLSKDGGILNNARFVAQRFAIQQIFDYPMGGRQMYLGGMYMAHNTWLDILNVAGIIPFFAFVAYTIYSLYKMICFLRKKSISAKTKIVIAGLYGSFFLYFTVEPALEASIHLVTPWIFLNGIIQGSLESKDIG